MLSHPAPSQAVLVVDDEPALRSYAEMLLAELGYAAVLAENGRAAVQKLLLDPDAISVVLLDMSMPGLPPEKTFQMLQEIRPDLPVIILSGDLESTVRERFGNCTIAGYVQKPYTDEELEAALGSALGSALAGARTQAPVALQLVGLPADELAQSAQQYLAHWRLEWLVMPEMLEKQDFPTLQSLGHRLKGSGGCFGFPELTEIGRELEEFASIADAASCHRQLMALEDCLRRSG